MLTTEHSPVALKKNSTTFRMRKRAWVVSALLSLSALSVVQPAQAQNSTGFAVNRFDPSERGSDWFWAESLDLRGNNRWALGVVGDWAFKPLVAYDENGDEAAVLLRHQVYAHLGANVVLANRIRLAANLPVLAYQDGEDVSLGAEQFTAPTGGAIGDLRLGADVRILGEYGSPFTLAAGAQVHIPTGNQEKYTSDGATRLVPRVMVAGDLGLFTYSLKTGVNFRFQGDSFAGAAFGHEWSFGGAAGLRLIDKKLTIGPELWASTVIEDGGDGFFDVTSTPFEGVLGFHYKTDSGVRFGAGAGPGFTQGLGSPQLRTLASLEWSPEPRKPKTPTDSDGDKILDSDDACPSKPGPKNEDSELHGCPLPEDTDGDGILNEEDACPEEGGPASDDPALHGCPLSDRDQDGIFDEEDACPDEAGVTQEDPEMNGCPLPQDGDGDGILDEQDACPTQAGPPNEDSAQHGCPRAQVVGDQVRILDRIEFDVSSADIRESSSPILQAVLSVLQDHPEIVKMRIEGHTDNRGGAWMNKNLSRKRAAAVKQWLVEQGIDATRLSSVGIGPDKPIDTNETGKGRQNNRRVEFHILETKKADDTHD